MAHHELEILPLTMSEDTYICTNNYRSSVNLSHEQQVIAGTGVGYVREGTGEGDALRPSRCVGNERPLQGMTGNFGVRSGKLLLHAITSR